MVVIHKEWHPQQVQNVGIFKPLGGLKSEFCIFLLPQPLQFTNKKWWWFMKVGTLYCEEIRFWIFGTKFGHFWAPTARGGYSSVFGRFLLVPFFKYPVIIIINKQSNFWKNVKDTQYNKKTKIFLKTSRTHPSMWNADFGRISLLMGFTKANLKNVDVLPQPPTKEQTNKRKLGFWRFSCILKK